MSNMSEDIQYVGSDTRPPMLDRTDYDSWQQRIRLYYLGKDNGENIMKSTIEGPYQMGTRIETLIGGVEGALQLGLPKDIYALINHYTNAKGIWVNVKMLLEGSKLTKDDRESQLYSDFKHFRQNKRESIHSYYVRFTKLINDMRNIKMTMPTMQLNSKFVNNMLPEWSRFITEVKLNRGLRESNFDQLYSYLKQHEVLANENKMMMERFTQTTNDPLALVSNASVQQMFVIDTMRIIKEYNRRGTMQEDLLELEMLEENGAVLDEEQLLFFVGEQVTNFDDDVNDPPEQDLALNVDHVFEADQCDAFDSDVDEAPTTQTMFMVNFSSEDPIYDEAGPSYDSNIPFEYVEDNAEQVVQRNVSFVQNDALKVIIDDMHEQGIQRMSANKQNKVVNDTLTSELARYKELVGVYET
nr:integrase, catalytic region, zinc finger, CCHC-type, peptidase aspartic, catalytic [Tanacetum cinerariifolium]